MEHYAVWVMGKDGARVSLKVMLAHPDVTCFGTDRLFAWDLLADVVSGAVGEGSRRELAERHVRRVLVGPVQNGRETVRDEQVVCVDLASCDRDLGAPWVLVDIEVADAAILELVEVGADFESWAIAGEEPALVNPD